MEGRKGGRRVGTNTVISLRQAKMGGRIGWLAMYIANYMASQMGSRRVSSNSVIILMQAKWSAMM